MLIAWVLGLAETAVVAGFSGQITAWVIALFR